VLGVLGLALLWHRAQFPDATSLPR